MSNSILRAFLAVTLTGACAGSSSSGEVLMEGMVYSDHLVDLSCEEQASLETCPQELSGTVLVFSDPSGESLGTTTTGPLEYQELDYGCRFLARYRISLPRAEAYWVDFHPPVPLDRDGSYYEGAEVLESEEISLEALERAAGRWDFEASPAYVTP